MVVYLLLFFIPTDTHFVYSAPLGINAFLMEHGLFISKCDGGISLILHLRKQTLRAPPKAHSSSLPEFPMKTWVLLFECHSILYLRSGVLSLWLVVMKPPLIWCVNATHLKQWAWGNPHHNATWKCILACLIEVFAGILQCFPAFLLSDPLNLLTFKKNITVHSQKHLSQIGPLTLDT